MRSLLRALLVTAFVLNGFATPTQAIVNGKQITSTDWSFMVAIGCSGLTSKPTCESRRYGLVDDAMYSPQFCAGSLIAPTVVVTAAHCLHLENGQMMYASDLVVGGGTTNLKAMTGTHVVTVSSILEDPEYNSSTQTHDLALLRLARPIDDTTTISWLPSTGPELSRGGLEVDIAGWGDVLPQGLSPVSAQSARFGLYSSELCAAELGANFHPNLMLCGTQQTGSGWIDTCQGDSGGPMTATVNGLRSLIGVISWGSACAEGKPGVYTSIPSVLPAVLEQLPAAPAVLKGGIRSLTTTVTGDAWMSGAWVVLAQHDLKISTCGLVVTPVSPTATCKIDGLALGGNYVVRIVPPIGVVPPMAQVAYVKGPPKAPLVRSVGAISKTGNAVVTFDGPDFNDAAVATRSVTCKSKYGTTTARAYGLKLVLTSLKRGTSYGCRAQALNVYGASALSAAFKVGAD